MMGPADFLDGVAVTDEMTGRPCCARAKSVSQRAGLSWVWQLGVTGQTVSGADGASARWAIGRGKGRQRASDVHTETFKCANHLKD